MNTSKLLPAGFLALMLAGTGAVVATAQSAGTEPEGPAAEAPMQRADFRGGHGERGEHRGRGERGEHGGRGGPEMFLKLFTEVDANADGSVTQDEIDAFRAAKVTGADASGDGALSIEEFDTLYREFTRARMVDAFQELDADGDGVISAAEMDRRFGDIVERMDRDDDGALTLQDRGRRG